MENSPKAGPQKNPRNTFAGTQKPANPPSLVPISPAPNGRGVPSQNRKLVRAAATPDVPPWPPRELQRPLNKKLKVAKIKKENQTPPPPQEITGFQGGPVTPCFKNPFSKTPRVWRNNTRTTGPNPMKSPSLEQENPAPHNPSKKHLRITPQEFGSLTTPREKNPGEDPTRGPTNFLEEKAKKKPGTQKTFVHLGATPQ